MEKRSKSITDGYLFNILSNQVLKCKCPHLKGKFQGSEWNDECRTDGSYIVQTFVLLFTICESESDYCMMRWARWQGVLVSSHVWYLVSTLANIRLALTQHLSQYYTNMQGKLVKHTLTLCPAEAKERESLSKLLPVTEDWGLGVWF